VTTWLIHGFNVRDMGKGSIDKLLQHIPNSLDYDYGYVGLISLKKVNRQTINEFLEVIKPGDTIVAHSNGCLIAYQIAESISINAIVCINPALRRDTIWPEKTSVLCLANKTDWIVELGRIWARLVSLGGIRTHGWGSAGRHGFTSEQPNVRNWYTDDWFWLYPVRGHSGLFKRARYWGRMINKWLHLNQV